jgi:flagellar biosynthesis GTPase FlhF
MSTPAELLRALGREARAEARNGSTTYGDHAIRTYRGRSVEDIIPKIQSELGADAIIVRRRDGLAGGMFGFFQHPYVEIEAMSGPESIDVYDDDEPVGPPYAPAPPQAELEPPAAISPPPPPAPTPPQPPPQPQAPPPPHIQRPAAEHGSSYVTARLAALARAAPAEGGFRSGPAPPAFPGAEPAAPIPPSAPAAAEQPSPAPPLPWPAAAEQPPPVPPPAWPAATEHPSPIPPPAVEQLRPAPAAEPAREPFVAGVDFHELIAREERRSYAQADADEEAALPEYASAPEYAPSRRSARPRERRAVAPGSQTRARAGVEKGLRRVGVSPQLAGELIDGAAAHVLPLAPRAGLAQAVRTTIAQRIPVAPPLPTRGAAIVVVGAGGTGKTTCCAALLAAYRTGSTLPASFATLTRGAQRDDLRLILAPRIVKPMAAGTPRALGALRRAKDEGLAVVDTPRMSPADKAGIRTLAHLLGDLEPERIVVALPATLGAQAATQLLTALRPLGANAMAVTHADETDQIGVAIEAACAFGLAPEYLLDCAPSGAWRLRGVDPVELAGRLLP